jgi:hypothetical protein
MVQNIFRGRPILPYVFYFNLTLQAPFSYALDYKSLIDAGKDVRHLCFGLRGANPEQFFGDHRDWLRSACQWMWQKTCSGWSIIIDVTVLSFQCFSLRARGTAGLA